MEKDTGIRVLAVEDDPTMGKMLSVILKQRMNAEVELAFDCSEAREKLGRTHYDVVTLDYQLPDGDGLAMLKEIAGTPGAPPVVMVTGHGDEQVAAESLRLGASGYVVKDRRLSVLLPEAVEHALSTFALRRAQEELRASEERFRLVFEHSMDVIFTIDRDLRVTSVSPSVERLLGYRPEELVGKSITEVDVLSPEYLDRAVGEVLRVLSGEAIPLSEYVFLAKDGTRKIAEISGAPLVRDGEIIGQISVARDVTDRKAAEEALRKREAELSLLLRTGGHGMGLYDCDGNLLMTNEQAAAYLNGEPRDFVGKNIRDFIPENSDEYLSRIATVFETGEIREYEDRVESPSGTRWFLSTYRPIGDEAGGFSAAQIVSVDITELKRAEEAARASEERFRTAAGAATDLIWEWDIKTGSLEWFGDVDGALGYEPGRFPRTIEAWEQSLHPDDHDRVMETLERCVREGERYYEEYRIRRKDGSYVYWTDRGNVIKGAGSAGKMVGACTDITEHKAAEAALRESEERLLGILQSLSDCVCMIDEQFNIVWVNDVARRDFGGDLVGRKCYEAYRNRASPCKGCCAARTFADGMRHEHEMTVATVEGRDVDLWCTSGVAARNEDGSPRLVVEVSRDVTDRNRKEWELRRVNADLNLYAHTVSHDLREPLAGIEMAISLLVTGASMLSDEEVRELLGTILRNSSRARSRVASILSLAESGQRPEEVEYLDVGKLVWDVLGDLSAQISERGIELRVDEDLGTVHANRTQLFQVFNNLVGNSIKHNSNRDPVIEIRYLGFDAERGHRYLVRDNGPGIPEDLLGEVFLPFRKGVESTGTGIGLATVSRIVDVYGGYVKAYNDDGACFEFSLRDFENA